jgi:hypothetical protein
MRIFRCLFGGMNSVGIDPQGVPVDLTGRSERVAVTCDDAHDS